MGIYSDDIGAALKMGVVDAQGTIKRKASGLIVDSDGDQILQAMLDWVAAHPPVRASLSAHRAMLITHTGFIEMGGAIRRFDNFCDESMAGGENIAPRNGRKRRQLRAAGGRWLVKPRA